MDGGVWDGSVLWAEILRGNSSSMKSSDLNPLTSASRLVFVQYRLLSLADAGFSSGVCTCRVLCHAASGWRISPCLSLYDYTRLAPSPAGRTWTATPSIARSISPASTSCPPLPALLPAYLDVAYITATQTCNPSHRLRVDLRLCLGLLRPVFTSASDAVGYTALR
jgi:hypothetical protein